jgi:hypothetical protein
MFVISQLWSWWICCYILGCEPSSLVGFHRKFRSNVLPPSSGSKSKPRNKSEEAKCKLILAHHFFYWFLVCLIFTLKMEVVCFSETSDFFQTTRNSNPEAHALHNDRSENLKSKIVRIMLIPAQSNFQRIFVSLGRCEVIHISLQVIW